MTEASSWLATLWHKVVPTRRIQNESTSRGTEIISLRPSSRIELGIWLTAAACGLVWLIYIAYLWFHIALDLLETTNRITSCCILIILYFVLSFPFAWGYIAVAVIVGFRFNFVQGVIINFVTCNIGLWLANAVIMHMGFSVDKQLLRVSVPILDRLKQILAEDAKNTKRIIVLSRLLPIPFGIQNTLFALYATSLGSREYAIVTSLALLPCQLIHIYIGTTLRSIKEANGAGDPISPTPMALFIFQMVAVLGLFVFIVRKANNALSRIEPNSGPNTNNPLPDPIESNDSQVVIIDMDEDKLMTGEHSDAHQI